MLQQKPTIQEWSFTPLLGASIIGNSVCFSVVSRFAEKMSLLLYDSVSDPEPSKIIPFDPKEHRRGNVWAMTVEGLGAGTLYHFQADGPFDPKRGLRFAPKARLIDPYAKALAGDYLPSKDGIVRPPKCVVVSEEFDWRGDSPICRPLIDSVIYEAHVRGMTADASSGVQKPGTYLGLIEKIPYLKSLGITTVELMPIHEFPTNEPDGTFKPIHNYWGYETMAFFAPHRGYAYSQEPGAQVAEFKELVRSLHEAGLEVILDVVFNHTAEGNEKGPTISFKGFGNPGDYFLNPDGSYRNYSGCGNTVNGNHPLMRELIFTCLRYWVLNYHIDGFRFDLASILSRDRNGDLVANPPILEQIAEDPLLADTKIIAEAWDAAGAYQVGSFGSHRWAEWNGRFRDDVRRFWQGGEWTAGAMATRLCGSSDLYAASGRNPESSINFVTAHDGFTLNDLVSYEKKHNEANLEENRDGENNNISCNFGIEGESDDPEVETLRKRQIRNFFVTLLISQGVPMISAGDEVRRTQEGNNNAWCQDNTVSWFDWSHIKREKDLLRFVRTLIQFRRNTPALRRRQFLTGQPAAPGGLPDITWFSPKGGNFDWSSTASPVLSFLLTGNQASPDTIPSQPDTESPIFAMFNGTDKPIAFSFPALALQKKMDWRLFIDTSAEAPKDIYPDQDGPAPVTNQEIILPAKSIRLYTAGAKR